MIGLWFSVYIGFYCW